jgi:hypothetical protein
MTGAAFLPDPWAWFAIFAVLTAGLAQAWRLGLIGRRYSLSQLQCDSDAGWWVVSPTGIRLAVRFGDASRVGADVVWLAVRSAKGIFWLLLLRFSVPDPIWRQLQARLRWVSDSEAGSKDQPQDDSAPS